MRKRKRTKGGDTNTIIVNKPGYLLNAKFSIKGDEMTIDVKDLRGILKRIR